MSSLSQNFSFGKTTLDLAGKSGLQTAFSKAFSKTNRVLEKALSAYFFRVKKSTPSDDK
jgi:ketopantoate hydroxymethyltransferase